MQLEFNAKVQRCKAGKANPPTRLMALYPPDGDVQKPIPISRDPCAFAPWHLGVKNLLYEYGQAGTIHFNHGWTRMDTDVETFQGRENLRTNQ